MEPSIITNPPLSDGQATTHVLEIPHIPDEATVNLAQFDQFLQTLPRDPIIFHGVAATLRRRFESETSRNITTIDCAIVAYDRAVDLTPPEDTAYVSRVCDATVAFILPFDEPAFVALHRDRLVASKLDISRRIGVMNSLVAGVGDDGHPLEATIHQSLANLYYGTFELSGNVDDLSCCISSYEHAVSLFQPRGGKEHRNGVFLFSFCLLQRFQLAGDISDYSTTIKYRKELLEDLLSVEEEHRATILEQQSSTLLRRSVATASLEDLEDAIAHQEQSLALTPRESDDHPRRLCSLSSLVATRSRRTKNVADIDKAIAYATESIDSTTIPSRRPERLSELGSHLSIRASLTRSTTDISTAIDLQQQAICGVTPTHPRYVTMLTSLGTSFMSRYTWTKATADLSYAISAYEEVLKYSDDRAHALQRLANHLTLKFQHHQHTSQSDIDRAVSFIEESIRLTPPGNPSLPSRWEDLGFALSLRFKLTANPDDINNSIHFAEKALSSTPANSAEHPYCAFRLCNSLSDRFDSSLLGVAGCREDLDRAIALGKGCMSAPNRPPFMETPMKMMLAILLARRYTLDAPGASAHLEDIRDALHHFTEVAMDPTADPTLRTNSAILLAHYAQDSTQTLQACGLAISLYPEYASLATTMEERYTLLETSQEAIARCSAFYALKYGETELAVDWLEQARCLVWTQLDSFQPPPLELSATHPELAKELAMTSAELRAMGSRTRRIILDGGGVFELLGDSETIPLMGKQMELVQAWRSVLARIREAQGFSSFLQPMTTSQYLENAPKEGPVVIVTTLKTRADAIALVAGRGFVHIPLRDVNATRVEEMTKALQTCLKGNGVRTRCAQRGMRYESEGGAAGLSETLADLWVLVVEPILISLGYSPVEDIESRPRIWWCPIGSFGFLPLHAAGIYGEDAAFGACASDYVVSSYTPTITMLLKKQTTPQLKRNNRLLVISQPATPGLAPIPATKEEADHLNTLAQTAGIPIQTFTDDNATIEIIQQRLSESTWAHFACHAAQDPTAPLKSGFYLHDGRLELVSMINHFPNAEHAFLSACQTGMGYERLEEEAVHIAAGMLAAGYRGVVGTMWSIADAYGPIVAREFYQYLLERAEPDVDGGIAVRGDVLEFEDKGSGPESERVKGVGCEGAPAAVKRMDCTLSARALHVAICKLRSQVGDGENGLLTWVPYVHFGV